MCVRTLGEKNKCDINDPQREDSDPESPGSSSDTLHYTLNQHEGFIVNKTSVILYVVHFKHIKHIYTHYKMCNMCCSS